MPAVLEVRKLHLSQSCPMYSFLQKNKFSEIKAIGTRDLKTNANFYLEHFFFLNKALMYILRNI